MWRFDPTISSAVPATGPTPAAEERPVQKPLSNELLDQMHRYWNATNYLTVGQIYLQANPPGRSQPPSPAGPAPSLA